MPWMVQDFLHALKHQPANGIFVHATVGPDVHSTQLCLLVCGPVDVMLQTPFLCKALLLKLLASSVAAGAALDSVH